MTWETFYLICFLAGLMLSAVTLLGGMGHFSGHVPHVPHDMHVPHLPHDMHVPHVPHAHLPHVPHAVGTGAEAGAGGGGEIPWWNGFSIMIFLCWFGAAGYLLTRYGGLVAGVVLVLAGAVGAVGGAILFAFLTKVLMPHEHELTADETEIVGVVGHVSSTIRPAGTGEIVYEQLGARCSVPARSEDGTELAKQDEVFVVRYKKGIAYVRKWEEDEGLGMRD